MNTPFSAAASAYNSAAQLMQNPAQQAPAQPQGGPDFAQILADTVQSTVDKGNQADQLSMQMLNGQANIVDVVTAVSETELAIESMVTVRDKVISAYEEIMRMPM